MDQHRQPPDLIYKEGMDQWLLAVTSDPAAKGSAKDLEVAGAGPVHCRFSIPPSFLTMCSSERCLSHYLSHDVSHISQTSHRYTLQSTQQNALKPVEQRLQA